MAAPEWPPAVAAVAAVALTGALSGSHKPERLEGRSLDVTAQTVISSKALLASPPPHPFPPCPLHQSLGTCEQGAMGATTFREYPKATPNLSHLLPGLSVSWRNHS